MTTIRTTMTRRAVRGLALVVAAAAAAVSVAATITPEPAGALGRQAESVSRDKGFQRSYPALTAGSSTKPDPGACNAVTFCDTIPVDIAVPDIPLGDDYYVEFKITWDIPDLYDLDVYLFDDGQTQEEIRRNGGTDPDKIRASPYTEKVANTNDNPATMVIAEPRLGRYNLVINNASTGDVAYQVEARMFIAKFKRPFEVLEEEGEITDEDDGGLPIDTSGDTPPPPPVTDQSGLQFGPETPTLDDVDPGVDDELESLRSRKKGGGDQAQGVLPTGSTKPPGPPSAAALLFWLAIIPGGVLGSLAFWLVKRRRAGFTFG